MRIGRQKRRRAEQGPKEAEERKRERIRWKRAGAPKVFCRPPGVGKCSLRLRNLGRAAALSPAGAGGRRQGRSPASGAGRRVAQLKPQSA